MVSPATALGVVLLVAVNTAVAAVLARYFRLTLATRWGAYAFVAFLVPVAYVATTIVGGVLGLADGAFVGAKGWFFTVCWALPFFLGLSLHLFWLPPLSAVE